jgi:hypothetical protein
VRAREPREQVRGGILDRREKRLGQTRRRHRADGVAVTAGVLGRDPAPLAADRDLDRAPLRRERAQPARGLVGLLRPLADLALRQVADREQQVVEVVGAPRAMGPEPLQRALQVRDRVRVEELAQLRLAEKLAQLRRVDGERLRPPLRERRVAVVDEVRDVGEEERGGEVSRRIGKEP